MDPAFREGRIRRHVRYLVDFPSPCWQTFESIGGPWFWSVMGLDCLRFHLISGIDTALSILILRKETLIINTPSPQAKLKLLAEFRDCIDTATSRKFIQIRIVLVNLNRAFQFISEQKTLNHHLPFRASRDLSPHLFHRHRRTTCLVLNLVAQGVHRYVAFRPVIALPQVKRGFLPLRGLNRSISRNVGLLPVHPGRLPNGEFRQNCNCRMDRIVLCRNSRLIL